MDAQLKRIKIEAAFGRDDQLSIEHALPRERFEQRSNHLGEVAIEGFLIAALKQNLIAVAKNENAETVPLRLKDPIARRGDGVDALGQHGEQRRIDGQLHAWSLSSKTPQSDARRVSGRCTESGHGTARQGFE